MERNKAASVQDDRGLIQRAMHVNYLVYPFILMMTVLMLFKSLSVFSYSHTDSYTHTQIRRKGLFPRRNKKISLAWIIIVKYPNLFPFFFTLFHYKHYLFSVEGHD